MNPQLTIQSISRVSDKGLKVEVRVVIPETGSTYNFNQNVPFDAPDGFSKSVKTALQQLSQELSAIAEVARSTAC